MFKWDYPIFPNDREGVPKHTLMRVCEPFQERSWLQSTPSSLVQTAVREYLLCTVDRQSEL